MFRIFFTQRVFFILCILFANIKLYGTHIVGGELTYECLGNNRYRVSLTVFRDCDTGVPPFDNPASIGIFDAVNNQLLGDIRLTLMNNDTLSEVLEDPCFVIPPNVCIHGTVYTDTITLPYRANGYIMSYQRCCRNTDIQNIIDPLSTGATYMIKLSSEAQLACNKSPIFNAWPPIYLCKDKPFTFDHSAYDADGDSLVYELCSPFDGATAANPMPQPPFNPPYDSIRWLGAAGFSTNNMMGGTHRLNINAQTGVLSGTPPMLGVFVVGVRVKEYRNGVLMSQVQRDFQYIVGECGRVNNAAFFTPNIVCSNDLTIFFNNDSNSEINTYFWDFGVSNSLTDTSSQSSPIFTYPRPGVYTITLIAAPNTLCSDTFSRTVDLRYNNLTSNFSYAIDGNCTDSITVIFTDLSTANLDNIIGWHWEFGDGHTSQLPNPSHTYTRTGNYSIKLTVTAANGCVQNSTQNFNIILPNTQDLTPAFICPNTQSIVLNQNANNNNNISYNWSPSQYLSATNIANPTMTIDAQFVGIVYNVEMSVINSNGLVCSANTDLSVQSAAPYNLQLQANPQICSGYGSAVASGGNFSNIIWAYDRLFHNVFANTDTVSYQINTDSAYLYVITMDNFGCIKNDSILVRRNITPIQVNIDYELINCGATVKLIDNSHNPFQNIISRNWIISLNGSIILNSQDSVIEFSPNNGGIYNIQLRLSSDENCSNAASIPLNLNPAIPLGVDTVFACNTGVGVQLNSSISNNQTYSWSPSTYLNNANIGNPISYSPTSVTYTVTITNNSTSPVCSFVDTVRLERTPAMVLDIPNYTFVCGNSAFLQLNVTGGHGTLQYEWATDPNFTNIVATTNPATITNAIVGQTYYIKVKDALGCIAIGNSISTDTLGNDIQVDFDYSILGCQGDFTIQLNDRSTENNISSWLWMSNFASNNTSQNPTFNIPRSGTYTVALTITLDNGCTAMKVDSFTVNVPKLDSIAKHISICPEVVNATINLNPNPRPQLTYQWQAHPDINDPNIPNPIATVSQIPAMYIVTITAQNNGASCENIDTVFVSNPLAIQVRLANDTSICYSSNFPVYAATQNAQLLEWSLDRNFSSIAVYNTNPVNLNFSNNGSTTVYIRATNNAGCRDTDSITVTRYNYLIPTSINYNSTNCESPKIIDFTSQVNNAYAIVNYAWDFDNGQTANTANASSSFTTNINNYTGNYNVELTVRDINGCIGSIIQNISFSIPKLTIADTTCSNTNSIVLNANNPNTNLTYSWANNTTFTNNNLSSATQEAFITATTAYTVTITDNNSNCSIIKNLFVAYNDINYSNINDTSTCSNEISLHIEGDSSLLYTWSLTPDFSRIISNSNPFISHIHANTTYYLRIENEWGCYKIDTIVISKANSNIIPNFSFELEQCVDSATIKFIDLSTSSDNIPINHWQWYFGDGQSSDNLSPIHHYLQNDTFMVTLEITNNIGCKESITLPLNINFANNNMLHYRDSICLGDSIRINTNAANNFSYSWDRNQAGLNDYNAASPFSKPNENTTYTAQAQSLIILSNIDTMICNLQIEHEVIVNDFEILLPEINLSCLGDNAFTIVELPIDSNISTYNWAPSHLISDGQGSNIIRLENFVEGDMVFVQAINYLGCIAIDSTVININNQSLNIELFANKDTAQNNDTIQLWVQSTTAANYQYQWSNNITNINNNTAESLINFGTANSVIYYVTVSNNNCISTDSITIFKQQSICADPYIFIPNTFTPNADGVNDLLYVRGNNITDLHFMIYNRWGELVFESHDQQIPWDGTFKGKTLAPDVYGYYLECKCEGGELFKKKGNVTILR